MDLFSKFIVSEYLFCTLYVIEEIKTWYNILSLVIKSDTLISVFKVILYPNIFPELFLVVALLSFDTLIIRSTLLKFVSSFLDLDKLYKME